MSYSSDYYEVHMEYCSSKSTTGVEYVTEVEFVKDFLSLLEDGVTPWGELETTTEWDYRSGITDVLARTNAGDLVAFEAKLRDWKGATHQAYRNTTFVRKAYVVMPFDAAKRASRNESIFVRYGVGLCTLVNNNVRIVIEAPEANAAPLLPWMHEKAQVYFDKAATCESKTTRSASSGLRGI